MSEEERKEKNLLVFFRFEKYINKDAVYGGAKLVLRKGKAFFHVSVTLGKPFSMFPSHSAVLISLWMRQRSSELIGG